MGCVCWKVSSESGVYGARRDARRLARRRPGSGPMTRTTMRVRRTVAPCLLKSATPEVVWAPRLPSGTKKPPPPDRGRAVSGPWYHPTSRFHARKPPRPARRGEARCGGSVTGAGCPAGRPPPPTGALNVRPFGAELGGLVRRRPWSRFAAGAVLWPASAGYSSSSSLRSSVVGAQYQRWGGSSTAQSAPALRLEELRQIDGDAGE